MAPLTKPYGGVHGVEVRDAAEAGEDVEEQLHGGDEDGAVEAVLHHRCRPLVRVAAVHQEQAREETELAEAIVGGARGLQVWRKYGAVW